MTEEEASDAWQLHIDGNSNAQGSGVGLVLADHKRGVSIKYALLFCFKTSNNTTEYEAIIAGLDLAKRFEAKNLVVHSDSQLVINQIKGNYQAHEETMVLYLQKVKELTRGFNKVVFVQVPQTQNAEVDALAKRALGFEVADIDDVTVRDIPTL